MTREEKIFEFMSTTWGGRRWCTANICACMGCVNASLTKTWKNQNPDEPAINKEEFNSILSTLPPEPERPNFYQYNK